ncbi:lysophospholipid acyltransferase family protein [Novosphingobium aerophilum]|uniref:lysophospholipid acyltransferase family protein n=1 Tax=Novosphingobium TaxID=165696 RepID=UPI0006C840C1|nr:MULTISPECIES: lysophospholipid acyltransferase family protein [unclassified Novosphingobium]KPH60645.1 glycerol acyltransferase [Novosphingobium sp. ST904]MPS67869.1 1-acyl-sn-glycerol-3-phosphate acyltransferase [Novosphingobium sp.]TCM39343.1 1-acyl-sn-glycerol-3-phosphate acyltransferase [Novosphingobium sp. ST904]WRT92891.1 lysophospholipid acyltransferase family protein [Novosphingobium sp. RL4]
MRTNAIDVIRSLLFYLVFYPGTLVFVTMVWVASLFGQEPMRRSVRGWARFHRLCCRWLLGIRLVIEGEMPEEGVLVAMKHESFFEAIDLPAQMQFPAPFPKAELIDIPGWGWAARQYGAVVVQRDQGARALRAMVASARGFASQGRPLAIFPEGTRVPHGQRAPLQAGFAGLYKLLGLPVVPVAVDSGRLYHRRWKKPGTITLRVGERIEPGLARDEIEARVQTAINALNP